MTDNGFIDLGDLAPIEVRYKIGGKTYVLREATEAAASTWERHRINSRTFSEDGKFVSLKESADDLDALLISLTLFLSEEGKDRQLVPFAVVRTWPSRITDTLAKTAKEISGLDVAESAETLRKEIEVLERRLAKVEGEGSAKNAQAAGTATSVSATS